MDIEHFYIEKGQGFPIILLHGNGGSSEYFQEQITEFSKYYHVYAIDTRGHGKHLEEINHYLLGNFQKI